MRSVNFFFLGIVLSLFFSAHAETLPSDVEQSQEDSKNFRIEGEDECLSVQDINADLKALHAHLPEDLAYVSPKVLEEGKDPTPHLLKAFKIAPSDDPSAAQKGPEVQHINASNTGRMFSQLQQSQEAQMSAEGTAPAWVIEAKMKEKSL